MVKSHSMMQTNHQLPRLRKHLPTVVIDDTAAHQGKGYVFHSLITKTGNWMEQIMGLNCHRPVLQPPLIHLMLKQNFSFEDQKAHYESLSHSPQLLTPLDFNKLCLHCTQQLYQKHMFLFQKILQELISFTTILTLAPGTIHLRLNNITW